MTYQLLDCGDQQKLERFGEYVLVRPAASALWRPSFPAEEWKAADARFSRDVDEGWVMPRRLPKTWTVSSGSLKFKISLTSFGHVGLFPEHLTQFEWMSKLIKSQTKVPKVLNLFAYSGAATLAAAKAGAEVCHLDASKGMVNWARENAALNQLEKAPIRWIVDDVFRFLSRENKRGVYYDGIILDPPSFGRGSKGECFKIERDLLELLDSCLSVLKKKPLFVVFSSHTAGLTPLVQKHLLGDMMAGFDGKIECGEMVITGEDGSHLPCGAFARWKC